MTRGSQSLARRSRRGRRSTAWLAVIAVAALGCGAANGGESATAATAVAAEGLARATFAGGCFWCMEPPFDELEGVVSTTSGYTGGHDPDPTYEEVSSGATGHAEALEVLYDPEKIGYAELLEVFWRNIDPTVASRQFCDRGTQYRSGIFYHDEEQKRLAEASRRHLIESGRFTEIKTEIVAAGPFFPAEEYHQDYYKKNPVRYKIYRTGCGRDRRLRELWSDEAGH